MKMHRFVSSDLRSLWQADHGKSIGVGTRWVPVGWDMPFLKLAVYLPAFDLRCRESRIPYERYDTSLYYL